MLTHASTRVLLGFGAFGVFWGAWGGILPAVQRQAAVNDGELGGALLLVGLGALPSMRLTGHLLDRFGVRVVPAVVLAFAACGTVAGFAGSPAMLAVALLALGAASGAFDVVINAGAIAYETATGRPLLNLAHATFSASAVVASALAGLGRWAGGGPPLVLGVVAALLCATAFLLGDAGSRPQAGIPRAVPSRWRHVPLRLIFLGALCALAYMVENAQQSWSAIHLEATLRAPPQTSALAPSLFAAATLTSRLAGQPLASRLAPSLVIAGGGLLAGLGTALAAAAPAAGVALIGVAVAGLGTGVCAPTIISLAGRGVPPGQRGSVVSIVTTIAYLGFLLGPVLVGWMANQAGLRPAFGLVAALALVLALGASGVRSAANVTLPSRPGAVR
jgi:MFS family permease